MNKKAQIKIFIFVIIILILGTFILFKINEKEEGNNNPYENVTDNKTLEDLIPIKNDTLSEDVPCEDECSKEGVKICSGKKDYLVCGNFDEDSCYEWSEKYSCPEKQICTYDECKLNSDSEDFDYNINFSNIDFQTLKSSSGNKITLAYFSSDLNISLLSEVASITSGITGEEGVLNFVPFSEFSNNFEIVILKIPFNYDSWKAKQALEYFSSNETRTLLVLINVHSGPESETPISSLRGIEFGQISLPIYNRQDESYFSIFLPRAFVHEIGHAIGSFGDEYSSFMSISPVLYNNIEYLNIDSEGCPKWCSGEINSDSPDYESYLSLKSNCINPYLNQQGLLSIPEDQKKSFDTCLGNYPEYYNWNLGKNCIEGTGCFFGAWGLLDWRSEKEGIMRNAYLSSKSFGVIGTQSLRTELCLLLDNC